MTPDELTWFEDWFDTLNGRLVALSVRQTMLHADLHGLRDALFRLQAEPNLSPRQLLEQWKASAASAADRLDKDAQHALRSAARHTKRAKRQRHRVRRKTVA
jgi:hypothetical protein